MTAKTVKIRKNIRNAVVDILKGATTAGDKVYPNFSAPVGEENLPVVLVYYRSEPVELFAQTPRELKRNLSLAIEIMAQGSDIDEDGKLTTDGPLLSDILDDMCMQVEEAMAKDDTLNGTCDDSILSNTEFEYEGESGVPIGSAILVYDIEYYALSPASLRDQVGVLPPFKGVDVSYDLDNDGVAEATDKIDLEF